MAKFKLNRKTFILGLMLLAFMPFSADWRLYLFGDSAVGVIADYNPKLDPSSFRVGSKPDYGVLFMSEQRLFQANIRNNAQLYPGQSITVRYATYNPNYNVAIHVAGIYRGWNFVFMLLLMLFWLVAFLNIKY